MIDECTLEHLNQAVQRWAVKGETRENLDPRLTPSTHQQYPRYEGGFGIELARSNP